MTDKPEAKPPAQAVTTDSMQPMLEALASLLGRLAFPPDELRKVVMKAKRKPEDYARAYNLCDGEHGVGEIAKEIGVVEGTLSPILASWKEMGIVYQVTNKGRKFYKRLYPLDTPRASRGASPEAGQVPTEGDQQTGASGSRA